MSDSLKEAEGDRNLQMPENITSLPSISEADHESALLTSHEFEQRDYESCLGHMKSLLANRPQDPKVLHNLYVAEFYLSNCRKIDIFRTNILEVCKQANISFDSTEILEDVDHCVLFYNQAVMLYHLNQHHSAIKILDKVFQFIEPLDEVLASKVCFLLLELYLSTFQQKKALGLIAYIETLPFISNKSNQNGKSGDKDKDNNKEDSKEKDAKESVSNDVLKPRLQQYKARCFALMKTAKACKREIKSLMSSSGNNAHNILSSYLKSQLEYQRGNYRKALKILNSPTVPENMTKFFTETGDCLPALYYNNVGCIHFYMGKQHLGCHYFGKALVEYENIMQCVSGKSEDGSLPRQLHLSCISTRYSILYNLGMQHLHAGNYQKAFDCFFEVVKVYSMNPRLWLRLAECCIYAHKSDNSENCQPSLLKRNLVNRSAGSGPHRKIILSPSLSKEYPSGGVIQSPSDTKITLQFASMCLCNALKLLPEEIPASATPQKSGEDSESSQAPENNSVEALPSCPIQGTELCSLRNSILIASSYVSLCVGDVRLAYKYSQMVLSQPKVSGVHRYLAHLYAGEALILMDRITEATDHLNPDNVKDITFTLPASSEETKSNDKADETNKPLARTRNWFPSSFSTARVISLYNLTVAFTLREEWEKASEWLRQVFAAKDHETEIPSQAYMLAIYIKLQQGFADKAKSFIKQNLPQYR